MIDDIKKSFSYDEVTGEVTWLTDRRSKKMRGMVAGCLDGSGRRVIKYKGKVYKAHRIAWLLHYGEWPSGFIDHINRDPSDNRISNLRVTDHSGNAMNRGVSSNNTSGYKGVYQTRSGTGGPSSWRAVVYKDGELAHISHHKTAEDAYRAYLDNARNIHGEFFFKGELT